MSAAASVPRWVATSKTRPNGSSPHPTSARPSSRWAELEIGRNSVIPWTAPRSAAMTSDMVDTRTGTRYEALALRRARSAGGAGAAAAAAACALAQDDGDRGGDEDRRVGAADDADEHREGEALEHFAAEQVQREHGEERGAGGDDGAAQRLVDAVVDHLLERFAAQQVLVLAHAVEDDDGVVHRVAGDGQDAPRSRSARARSRRTCRNASVTRMSWKVAAMAPTAKLKRKRNAM